MPPVNIICYDTFLLQQTELSHVHVCPLAHSPLETSLKAPTHFHYFEYGESQPHTPARNARSRPCTHSHTRSYLSANTAGMRECAARSISRLPLQGVGLLQVRWLRGSGVNRATLLLKYVALIFPLIPH